MHNNGVRDNDSPERFNPLMLYNILDASRRFEPDFYSHLCRTYHLDADRILGLFSEVEQLGSGQLQPVLAELREHHSYHDIVYLAGRNSLHMWLDQEGIAPSSNHGGAARFTGLVKRLLPAFLGHSNYSLMVRGNVQFVEVRDSVFTRGVKHEHPVCGFYSGYLAELGSRCIPGTCGVTEVRCTAVELDATTCLFQVNL
jgi:hypothetical protein